MELASNVIKERLASLGISLAPVAADKTAPDVLLVARRAAHSSCRDVVRVLAHSSVLKKECDYFREWFIDYDVRMAEERRRKALVADMVQSVMRNVEEEAKVRQAITGMLEGVMTNVIELHKGDEEEEAAHGEEAAERRPGVAAAAPEEEVEVQRYIVIEKLEWTAPVLHAILEWLYTRCCHIDVEHLWAVYEAADKMVLSSLSGAIRDYSSPHYLRYALDKEEDRKALLRLCSKARCAELGSLRVLCESLSRSPISSSFCMLLHTAAISYRRPSFLPEGLYTMLGHPVCCLKEAEPLEPLKPYITLVRESGCRFRRRKVAAASGGVASAKMKDVEWRIMDLGSNAARCCHTLFRYSAEVSFEAATKAGMLVKPVRQETFSLRMVTGSMVSSIIKCALGKAIPAAELKVKEERGSGYYIRGPSYCFSLLLQGEPSMILVGAKAIPHDMIGRAALRIRNPSERTFARFLPAMRSFGVDFEANTLYIIKPLHSIIRILEFVAGVSREAFTPLEFERHVVEVVEATDPF
ncbi:hypothetical protein SELMODRAFT_428427 [Selaginella moellendorffii]|uniref:BTB domain-containing protein n=1 Tax=Selaginella moellendorffii TaxID=88036 RepID=D8T2S6_SELML|nr:hypothetical protein SELMODRAFT_428427 [Selaginella moellendorffii]